MDCAECYYNAIFPNNQIVHARNRSSDSFACTVFVCCLVIARILKSWSSFWPKFGQIKRDGEIYWKLLCQLYQVCSYSYACGLFGSATAKVKHTQVPYFLLYFFFESTIFAVFLSGSLATSIFYNNFSLISFKSVCQYSCQQNKGTRKFGRTWYLELWAILANLQMESFPSLVSEKLYRQQTIFLAPTCLDMKVSAMFIR